VRNDEREQGGNRYLAEADYGEAVPLRMMVADEALVPAALAMPSFRWHILAPSEDLDAVAEAIAGLASGELYVGVDMADAFIVAGNRFPGTSHGRGIVIKGLTAAETCPSLIQTLDGFSAAGYDGGLTFIQLIAPQDDAAFDLAQFDAMTTRFLEENGRRPHFLFTAYPRASTTGLVMIAFK
jgi:hypothetical protein